MPHLGAIRQLLDKARADRNEPPPVRLTLPDDPRLDRLVVRPHSLASYDSLRKDPNDDPRKMTLMLFVTVFSASVSSAYSNLGTILRWSRGSQSLPLSKSRSANAEA